MLGFLGIMLFLSLWMADSVGRRWWARLLYWAYMLALLGSMIVVWLVEQGRL